MRRFESCRGHFRIKALTSRNAGQSRSCAHQNAHASRTWPPFAPPVPEAMRTIPTKAFAILHGTLLPIDRIAANTPYYAGKHKRHGMNAQVLTDRSADCSGPRPPRPARPKGVPFPASRFRSAWPVRA